MMLDGLLSLCATCIFDVVDDATMFRLADADVQAAFVASRLDDVKNGHLINL